MKLRNPWPAFGIRILVGLLLLVFAAVVSGQWGLVLLVGAVGLLFWDWLNLWRLEHWLRLTRKLDPPQSVGLWGDIFDGLHQMRRRSRDRDKRRRNLVRNYRDSIKAIPDGAVVLRGDYLVEWCNQAALRLLGLQWPRDEGQRISNIFRHPEFIAFLARYTGESRTLSLPSPIDSRRWLEIRLIPYAKKRYLLLARDTTQLRQLETMRRDFIANVSHELRTPLTVVYGVAEALAEELGDDPERARSVQLLQEQAERMKHLVDDLLLLSRLETGSPTGKAQWIDMTSLLSGLVEEARLLSGERRHQVELDATPGLRLLGNEGELRSAFANLLFNAVHYTPDGGQIGMRWFADAQGGHLQVVDNGIGIEAQHIDRLTERFYRVDSGRSKSQGGTGLGLAIVKHVLMRQGGELQIESAPGQGSTFTCHFPSRNLRQSLSAREPEAQAVR